MADIEPIKIDQEFHALIPPLSSEERNQLEENIKADGCREPLSVWSATLIDGHNRHEICTRLGIKYQVKAIELADRDAALIWIIDNQNGRRNIAAIDRIALAARREEIVARKAKDRQKDHGETAPGRPKNTLGKIAQSDRMHTRAQSARAAGVGERTYDAGKRVLAAAARGKISPETIEDIRRDRVAIHRVAKDIKEADEREERQKKRSESAKSSALADTRIIIGDFRRHADKVANGSLSLIFTDPPYDREASKLLPALGEFAAAKLADGGSLVLYVGQTQLPAALDALRQHLRYWWTIACVHAGRSTVMREYGINAGWKAVLWFVKGTRDNNSVMVNDVMSGGEEKSHHDWQQAESEAVYWIDKLTTKDGIICDPFLGGGTTAAAAKSLGRKWIGFEIDPDTAAIASKRVQ